MVEIRRSEVAYSFTRTIDMAIGHNQVTVTTEPTLIFGGDIDGAYVYIFSLSGVYLGDSSVSITNGHWRPAGSDISLFLGPSEQIYGIAANGTTLVSYLSTLNS